MKKQVTERALAARIDRRLNKRSETLRKCQRSSRWYRDLGKYYIADMSAGAITRRHIDLESLAREEDVLRAWEELS